MEQITRKEDGIPIEETIKYVQNLEVLENKEI